MKIAVISANGRAGKHIVQEAVNRNLDVTAIARGQNTTPAKNFIQKDLFALTYEDLKPFDVIIDAFGTFTPDTLNQHITSLKHLSDLLSSKPNRLLVVGGAGSLYVNPQHTMRLMDTPDFSDAFKPLATAMGEALEQLRRRSDVNWTYISPAADFRADAPRTGVYVLSGEELTLNTQGESVISYADYAIAMIDEALQGDHVHQRISVVGK